MYFNIFIKIYNLYNIKLNMKPNINFNNLLNYKTVINNIIFLIVFYIIFRYSLDFKIIYPDFLLDLYDEPLFKFSLYLLLFILSNYNITYSIFFFIFLMFLEFDYMVFIKKE